jgi:hypothetical protein
MIIYTLCMFAFIAVCIYMVETQPERPSIAREKLEMEKEFRMNLAKNKPDWNQKTNALL